MYLLKRTYWRGNRVRKMLNHSSQHFRLWPLRRLISTIEQRTSNIVAAILVLVFWESRHHCQLCVHIKTLLKAQVYSCPSLPLTPFKLSLSQASNANKQRAQGVEKDLDLVSVLIKAQRYSSSFTHPQVYRLQVPRQ